MKGIPEPMIAAAIALLIILFFLRRWWLKREIKITAEKITENLMEIVMKSVDKSKKPD